LLLINKASSFIINNRGYRNLYNTARHVIKEANSSTTIKNVEKIGDLGVSKRLSHSGCFAKKIIGTPWKL